MLFLFRLLLFLKTISKFTHFSGRKCPVQCFYFCFTIKSQKLKLYSVMTNSTNHRYSLSTRLS